MKSPRVFLYGFYGMRNAGNEAMLRAFVDPIKERLGPEGEFVVASRHPEGSYDQRYGVRSVQNLEYASRALARGRWLRGLNPDDSPALMAMLQEIAAADLVVLGPGQYLVETGEFGILKGALAQMATVVSLCTLTDTPCYGLALACETIQSAWSKLLIQQLLPRFARLTFRDPQSVVNLRAASIEPPAYEVLGDLALAGGPAPASFAEKVLSQEGVPKRKGPRLAVAMRSVYWVRDGRNLAQRVAEVLRLWLQNADRDVLMIPQNVYTIDGDRDDDRAAAAAVVECLPEELRSRIHQVRGEHDPAETEALYGLCDVTLSARLHGAVFSCKQGTPPVVYAFMDKTRGFFSRIRHCQCMVDLMAEPSEVASLLEHFLAHRDTVSQSILAAVGQVRGTACRYPEIAIDLLKKPAQSGHAWAQSVIRTREAAKRD